MKIVILYLVTVLIFFASDAIGLRLLIKPVFERHISHLFADPFRVVPAAIFYLGYVAGVLWVCLCSGNARERSGFRIAWRRGTRTFGLRYL